MIWLPLKLSLDIPILDWLLVDEFQDLDPCQQALVYKCGRRIMLTGDMNQAIYAFRGADADSVKTMTAHLLRQPQGCAILPLTTTFRCAKEIVRFAQALVPEFNYWSENEEGSVEGGYERDLMDWVQPSDMVVCRTNAPLVIWGLRMLRDRRKAIILGQSEADELIALVNDGERRVGRGILEWKGWLFDWHESEINRLAGRKSLNENLFVLHEDRYQCLSALATSCTSTDEIKAVIKELFNDKADTSASVTFSSIHRSKGREANRVFLLRPETIPHYLAKKPKALQQERNLQWVAITRARKMLCLLEGEKKAKDRREEDE